MFRPDSSAKTADIEALERVVAEHSGDLACPEKALPARKEDLMEAIKARLENVKDTGAKEYLLADLISLPAFVSNDPAHLLLRYQSLKDDRATVLSEEERLKAEVWIEQIRQDAANLLCQFVGPDTEISKIDNAWRKRPFKLGSGRSFVRSAQFAMVNWELLAFVPNLVGLILVALAVYGLLPRSFGDDLLLGWLLATVAVAVLVLILPFAVRLVGYRYALTIYFISASTGIALIPIALWLLVDI